MTVINGSEVCEIMVWQELSRATQSEANDLSVELWEKFSLVKTSVYQFH